MNSISVPVLPDTAPFTAEQRAYLNGFLAGMFSRGPVSEISNLKSQIPESAPLTPLAILFGSQTGNAENLAKRAAKEAGKQGFAPTVHELARYPTAQFASERHLLVITSTYGDGDPPDNARSFAEFLSSDAAPRLVGVRFSVCALGDSNYPKFCAFGKAVDERLAQLGGTRATPRTDCDVDCEEPFQKWIAAALSALKPDGAATPAAAVAPSPRLVMPNLTEAVGATAAVVHSKQNPFPAPLLTNHRLNGPGSTKDTRHFEFSLAGSTLQYEAGDALGVFPTNCPELVGEILRALDFRGTEPVPGKDGQPLPIHDALLGHYDITRVPSLFLQTMAQRTGDATLLKLTAPGVNGELSEFLRGREIIDVLLAFPAVHFAPEEFVKFLKKLAPRLYSISSSPKTHPGQVHLTTAIVRYDSLGRLRRGVCSTFLADRVAPHGTVPVFVHRNPNFRPPADPTRPMIMVGPGTGIAPFRAFLQERRAVGATGRNWLFFGDQKSATDFLYRQEIEAFVSDGTLTRLSLAWSRDQSEKIYVQQRMLEQAGELFAWLEDGGHFYVCGDATRMAKDVDAALHQVVAQAGGKTPAQAAEYVARLKTERRYLRDVY